MKIKNITSGQLNGRPRISAEIVWEDCNRPPYELYFETDPAFSADLTLSPHPFLVGCVVPALYYGEKRLQIDADVCPELKENLSKAIAVFNYWFSSDGINPMKIEAKSASVPVKNGRTNRAGFFFSGGVDSFSLLRQNRLQYPREHPGSLKDSILIYGLELDDPQSFQHVRASLQPVAESFDLEFIPVYTNLYLEYRPEDATNKFKFWWYYLMGSALAAVGHALANRLDSVSIASEYNLPQHVPHGCHPFLDPYYSSFDMSIHHEMFTMTRYEKVKLISSWDKALDNLRVCNQYKQYNEGALNCGRCEKCVRTMMALLAAGKLEHASAFPVRDVSPELAAKAIKLKAVRLPWYYELLEALPAVGRDDLVKVINDKIDAFDRSQNEGFLRKTVKKLDGRFFDGQLRELKNKIKPSSP
jgi:hypothetical protein